MRAQGSGPLSATTIAFLLVSIAAVALLIWTQTSTPHGAGYSDVEDEHYVELAEDNENDELAEAEAEELTSSEDKKEIAKTSKSKKDSKTKLKEKTSKSKGLTKSNKAEKKKSNSKKGKSDKKKNDKSKSTKKDKKDKKDKKSKSKSKSDKKDENTKSKNKKKSESDEDKTQSKRGKKKKRTPPKTEEKAEETTAIVAHEYEHNANMAITGQFLVRWDGCIQTDQCSVYRNEAQAFCDRMGEKCAGYTCGKGAAICQIRSPPLQYHPSNDFEAFFKRDPKK